MTDEGFLMLFLIFVIFVAIVAVVIVVGALSGIFATIANQLHFMDEDNGN